MAHDARISAMAAGNTDGIPFGVGLSNRIENKKIIASHVKCIKAVICTDAHFLYGELLKCVF